MVGELCSLFRLFLSAREDPIPDNLCNRCTETFVEKIQSLLKLRLRIILHLSVYDVADCDVEYPVIFVTVSLDHAMYGFAEVFFLNWSEFPRVVFFLIVELCEKFFDTSRDCCPLQL